MYELVLGPDRQLDRDAAVGELRAGGIEDAVEVGALAVEHVDEDDARELVLLGALPDAGRVDLDAHDAAQHDDDALDDPQRRIRVGLEAGVAGRVDEVDLPVVPLEMAERAGERHAAFLLVLVPVGGRRPLLDSPEPVRLSRLEEQRFDERGLPDAAVAGDGDVPDLGGLGGSHTGPVLLVVSCAHRNPAGAADSRRTPRSPAAPRFRLTAASGRARRAASRSSPPCSTCARACTPARTPGMSA